MQKMAAKICYVLNGFSVLPDSRKHCYVANGGNVFIKGWNVAMFEMVEGLWCERLVNWQTRCEVCETAVET